MASVLLLVKLGWRNLWRNPRRTLLTALALGLGLALQLIATGLIDGGREQVITSGLKLGSGHVTIQARGYQRTRSQKLLLPARVVAMTKELLRTETMTHSLQGMSPRLVASGLLSSAANTAGVSILGVSPEAEQLVSLIPQRMTEGTYLGNGGPAGVVIGAELARKLKAKVGSKVVLMVQAMRQLDAKTVEEGGAIESALFRVTGIFRTGLQAVDAHVIHLPLPAAQDLLGVPEQVTQVGIFFGRVSDSLSTAMHLREQLTGVPAEVLTWRESMPELVQMFRLEDAFRYVVREILLLMVGLGVLNTILMAVLERHYEFGVCAALGLRPGQLAGMILCESLILISISLTLGLVLGLGVHYYFAIFGFDLRWVFATHLPSDWVIFDAVIYSYLSPGRIAWSVSVVFMMTAVISLYPALKAARTELPDTLRLL